MDGFWLNQKPNIVARRRHDKEVGVTETQIPCLKLPLGASSFWTTLTFLFVRCVIAKHDLRCGELLQAYQESEFLASSWASQHAAYTT